MFIPRSAGSIMSNNSLGMAGAGGMVVNVYGDVTGTELVEKVKEALASEIKRRIR
jgi:hypothetical protein